MSSTSAGQPTLSPPVRRGQVAGEKHPAEGPGDDRWLVTALRAGNEAAFGEFVARHHASMVGVARAYVPSHAVAEEVVQETWEVALRRLDRFEQRSTLKTWIFSILVNRAKTRGNRERRTVPSSCLGEIDRSTPTVDPALFQGPDGRYPGGWSQAPRPWDDPERRLSSLEVRAELRSALHGLPEQQRLVVSLRDVEGLSSREVCRLLELSAGNQRVLLHRARAALRRALDEQL